MTGQKEKISQKDFPHEFLFESYGVVIRINSNKPELIEQIKEVIKYNLLNDLREIAETDTEHNFVFFRNPKKKYEVFKNGVKIAAQVGDENLIEIFGTVIRLTVAEFAHERVFVHAGAVGWKGKAIVIPAKSFQGKSTLTAALVKRGAVYYSDEYAIFDKDGFVHPFAKPISIREKIDDRRQTDYEIKEYDGIAGTQKIPVGIVLITEYKANARWNPKILSPANGILELIKNTIPIRQNPQFVLEVLNQIGKRAVFIKSKRRDISECADLILQLFENLSS